MITVVYQLDNHRMTVKISTDEDERIVDAAPIVRRFIGQPLENLIRWMSRIGETHARVINRR